jgi:nitrogenase-associated protein
MTHILFYEKPGCGGNAKQRALLEAAGHTLERRNLLTEAWTRETLLPYLQSLPVADWFNRAAPQVKSGEVVPEALTAEAAMALLLATPLLIRRPLMQRPDGQRLVGFDTAAVEAFVGLGEKAASPETPSSLEGCAAVRSPCPTR